MRSFPLFLRTDGRRVVIVGGGEQAAQKARLVGRSSARIELMAPSLDDELTDMVAQGRARHRRAVLDPAAFEDALFAMIGTGCAGADAAAAAVAQDMGVLVNVVDRPDLCDATMPALVDRDPLVIAIGTEGTAPVLARQVKSRLEAILEPRLGGFTALAGRLRERVARQVMRARRRSFWAWAFREPRQRFTAGDEDGAEAMLDAALAAGRAPDDAGARLSLMAPIADPDLATLRAVQRLQEADLVLFTADAAPLLELARRDAEREELPVGLSPAQTAEAIQAARSDTLAIVALVPDPAAVAEIMGSETEVLASVPQPAAE
ncbi:MAG: NAD(P)-dependent oxidoreductase [Pseudomonadota bacterium]